jgi:hypothetical protein
LQRWPDADGTAYKIPAFGFAALPQTPLVVEQVADRISRVDTAGTAPRPAGLFDRWSALPIAAR